jgi:hypothetical protein
MKVKKILLVLSLLSSPLYAENDQQLVREINRLQQQTQKMQAQLNKLQKKMVSHNTNHVEHQKNAVAKKSIEPASTNTKKNKHVKEHYHSTQVSVHTPEVDPESVGFYPTALVAENKVVTYIAGTPVVSSPYLGARPAFDGSDYIVNISSINRDIRLMQQRRSLYRAYQSIGYHVPEVPIIALSGKSEPVGVISNPFRGAASGDLTLGSNELDIAAILNQNVEAYVAIAYDSSPPDIGPRVDNSALNLNMGFVNIGNLDKTPFYFTAGQLFVPFGRYSSSMISAPLSLNLARTKTRPFILGYKSQEDTGLFAAAYIYKSDTILGKSGVGGLNVGYIYKVNEITGEVGASYISSIADSSGMQTTDAVVGTTFGGFSSLTNGSELVRKTPAVDVHGNIAYDRFNLAAEWVSAIQGFRPQDLSYNGQGAKPQAGQAELGITFRAFDRPSSVGIGYQWTKDALALNLPEQRIIGVFNISIWKDTVESLEYRHDIDYNIYQFANGAAPIGGFNATTYGTGRTADTISAQIGVYF